MANRISGITIEINGDTSKLSSALSGVNKDLRATQTALRDVDKLLKFNPGNTDLLRQKQQLLKTAIEDTKQKLDTEKEALAQLASQDQTPEVTAQMQTLQRQIIEDENELKRLQDEAKSFGSVAKQQFEAAAESVKAVGEKVSEAGDKIKGFGEGMTKNVTAPLAAVGGASLAAFSEVDEGLDTIIRKTGATGASAEEMGDIMESIATTIPTDFATAGNAIGEVNTRFGVTGDELEELSTQFIQFASLNETDVTSAVDSTQKALAAFGLGAENAGRLLDAMNATGQRTGVSVDALASGLVSNAAAFDEMGLNIFQATEFMGDLETSGADSSTVLAGLGKALKNATADGVPLNDALGQLQNSIRNGTGEVDGLTMAYELFGKSGATIYEAVKNGTVDFTNLGKAADITAGSVSETFDATLDPIDSWQTTLNQLKLTGAELGATLGSVLQPILEKVGEVVKTLKERWEALSPETQDAIVKAAMIAAAVGPIIAVVGSIVSGIGSLISGISMLMSPVGLVIAAIAAAIAIGVALYQNWDEICAWAENLKQRIVEAWENIKTSVTEAVDNMKTAVTETWENIKSGVSTAVNNVKNTVTTAFTNVRNTVTTTMSNVRNTVTSSWSAAQTAFANAGGGIRGIVAGLTSGIRSLWTGMFNTIDSLTGGRLSAIYNWFTSKFSAIQSYISGVVQRIRGIFNFSWSFPHIRLPHFSWSWQDIGGVVKIPRISVTWYKKAYDEPYLFTQPTVMRGFGDGGGSGEIVYGRDQLMRDIAKASGGSSININVYAQPGQDARQIANEVQRVLAQQQRQKEAVYA